MMVPRGRLEPKEAASEEVVCSGQSETRNPMPSLGASQNAGKLGLEMAEIVSAWPNLAPEIREAILILLRAAK
jgi:hypothetical protein